MSDRLTLEEWFLSEEAERLREERYVSGYEVGWLDGQRAMRERAAATEPTAEDQQRLVDEANQAALRAHLRERYHDAQIAGWRQVCLDHGIQPDAGSLRVHLEVVLDRLLRLAGREVGR